MDLGRIPCCGSVLAKNLTQRCKNKYDKACKLYFKVGDTFYVCIKHIYRSYGPENIKKVKQIRMAENRAAAISRKRLTLLAK